MALTGAVTKGSGTNNFTVTYGTNVTPSDDGETLNGQSAKFAANPANWDNVNCIKIVANNIPANPVGTISKYDFTYTLKTINTASATDGTLDTWRPVYYQNLVNSNGDNFAGWKNGNYVSLKLVDGKLNGKIFLDTNENGKLDSGESALNESGWSLALYNKSSNELVKTTTTNSNGEYSFGEIPMSANGYYITVTNKHPINGTGTTYLFTPKGTASNTGSYNTDNQAAGDQTSSPIHKTAKIDPISPSMTAGQATYNIGVVAYSATESYSGKITFSDLDNSYNTRPASVTITAVDNESSSRTIEVPTNNGGNYVVNLPKYNSKGQKLSYSLSAPALVNYNKSEETTDNGHRFNVTYTLKTSTLRTHYYKVGTTEK